MCAQAPHSLPVAEQPLLADSRPILTPTFDPKRPVKDFLVKKEQNLTPKLACGSAGGGACELNAFFWHYTKRSKAQRNAARNVSNETNLLPAFSHFR